MLLSQEIFRCQQQTSIQSVVEGRAGGRCFFIDRRLEEVLRTVRAQEKSRKFKALNSSKSVPSSWDGMSLEFSREVTACKQNSKYGQVLLECHGILMPAGQTFLREQKL